MATIARRAIGTAELLDFAESIRLDANRGVDESRRSELGQYFTPAPIARRMASWAKVRGASLKLLDPGAGVGVLAAAWVAQVCTGRDRPERIDVCAFEVDSALADRLDLVLRTCQRACAEASVDFTYTVRNQDFIGATVETLGGGLFAEDPALFDCAILNPPYRKIRTDSAERAQLKSLGIETSNLYTAFIALALRSLRIGGELISINPRSFCNGPYFTSFRKDLLRLGNLTHLHTFAARDRAFQDDDVLQENIIMRLERGIEQSPHVEIEWSQGGEAGEVTTRSVPVQEVVNPADADAFIHVVPDEWDAVVADIIQGLPSTLSGLGAEVSTGRVVDFRSKGHLRADAAGATVPLIYPAHFSNGRIKWPIPNGRKPNALEVNPETESLLNRSEVYVLVKRFTSKEERRRVVAALFLPHMVPGTRVAFENHLNVYHQNGRGLPRDLAEGLAAYLNSSLVDGYFRQFSGHTQVNATDLRKLRYPRAEQLKRIGKLVSGDDLSQERLDDLVERELLTVAKSAKAVPPNSGERISEALEILKALGLPREQQNDRSALTLLALLALKPTDSWRSASNPLMGVTPIMDFAAEHYGKKYAPNTRETVRRQTLHQFEDAGIVVRNPDNPGRPVNSPAYCYQVPKELLSVLRAFGSRSWSPRLSKYVATAGKLAELYAQKRSMNRIPLKWREGQETTLSPGGQNELIKAVVEEFCVRFTPGAQPVYIGDADEKWAIFDEETLAALGVRVDSHGKMPDVVVHFTEKNWLVLIEAVTSHGPVSAKRHGELKRLFGASSAPLVFVTAFMDRRTLNRYLGEIAWETEVWVAEAPSHMIHFNGERFLGPYE